MGADDYITKPFSQRLLIERIRALLRRDKGGVDGGQPGQVAEAPLVRGELTLDPARHPRTWKGGRISLTVTELLILKPLAQRPGLVQERDQLIAAAPAESADRADRHDREPVGKLRVKSSRLREG